MGFDGFCTLNNELEHEKTLDIMYSDLLLLHSHKTIYFVTHEIAFASPESIHFRINQSSISDPI